MTTTKIIVPSDRTHRQPVRAFCRNPECRESSVEFTFEVHHDSPACPKCGANYSPMIGLTTLTHFIRPSESGPITGKGGQRLEIVCDKKRAYLATFTNLEAVSAVPGVVNCPECLVKLKKEHRHG